MKQISIVIIAKNEAATLGPTLDAVRQLTDDVLIADNGSTDETKSIALSKGARVIDVPWEGFGITKRKAAMQARYDWILAIDADEKPDPVLLSSLQHAVLDDEKVVYRMRFRSFIGSKEMRYGEWRPFYKIRLFNRQHTNWDEEKVHESIVMHSSTKTETLAGDILHATSANLLEYANKMNKYAAGIAAVYHQQGKKAGWFKLYCYPTLIFWQTYLIRLGFLDGTMGFASARITAHYVFMKYHLLREMNRNFHL